MSIYKVKVSKKQNKEICNDAFTSATYINGIIEIIFIISIVVSIKYPLALYCSLLAAITAVAVNAKLIVCRKNNKENGADR